MFLASLVVSLYVSIKTVGNTQLEMGNLLFSVWWNWANQGNFCSIPMHLAIGSNFQAIFVLSESCTLQIWNHQSLGLPTELFIWKKQRRMCSTAKLESLPTMIGLFPLWPNWMEERAPIMWVTWFVAHGMRYQFGPLIDWSRWQWDSNTIFVLVGMIEAIMELNCGSCVGPAHDCTPWTYGRGSANAMGLGWILVLHFMGYVLIPVLNYYFVEYFD